MVKLRLKRAGKKRAAFYRIVASDARVQRDGAYIELIGTYNPINGETKVNNEVAIKWLQQGAQPTDTVRNILSDAGVMTAFHNVKQEAKKNAPKKDKKDKKAKPAVKKPAVKKTTTAAKKSVAAKSAEEPVAE